MNMSQLFRLGRQLEIGKSSLGPLMCRHNEQSMEDIVRGQYDY
jgi:hypothetical protein